MTPKTHRHHVWRWVFGVLGGLVVAAVAGVLVWSQVGVMGAEPEPLATVRADARVAISDDTAGIVLAPASGQSATGLVFIPGAKVDPWAYAAILSGLVTEDDVTVIITKPWLNLAFFDPRGLSSFTDLAPGTGRWLVGGHSLGGVRACQLAGDADGLVLFASYCANDLSGTTLPTLSLAGSEDGLSTPQKITDARHNLPADAVLVELPGASHASFGDYGPQSGDGTPTTTAAEVEAVVVQRVGELVRALP